MNNKDSTGCIKNVSSDIHNVLYAKIGKLIAFISKLSTQNTKEAKPFKPKYIWAKGEVKTGKIILIEKDSKTKIGLAVQIALEDLHTEETSV